MISTINQTRHHWPVLGRTNKVDSPRFNNFFERRANRLVLLETFQSATQAVVMPLLLVLDLIYLFSHKLHLLLQLTEHAKNHFSVRLFSLSRTLSSRTNWTTFQLRIHPHRKRRTFRNKRRERHRMRCKSTVVRIRRTRRRHHRRHGREEPMTMLEWEWCGGRRWWWRRRHMHPRWRSRWQSEV